MKKPSIKTSSILILVLLVLVSSKYFACGSAPDEKLPILPNSTPIPDGTPSPGDTPIPDSTPTPDGTPTPHDTSFEAFGCEAGGITVEKDYVTIVDDTPVTPYHVMVNTGNLEVSAGATPLDSSYATLSVSFKKDFSGLVYSDDIVENVTLAFNPTPDFIGFPEIIENSCLIETCNTIFTKRYCKYKIEVTGARFKYHKTSVDETATYCYEFNPANVVCSEDLSAFDGVWRFCL